MSGKENERARQVRLWITSFGGFAGLAAIIAVVSAMTSEKVVPASSPPTQQSAPTPQTPEPQQKPSTPQTLQTQQAAPRIDIQGQFIPSGWMGDGKHGRKYIEFTEVSRTNPHSAPDSIKVRYTFGSEHWGGIYWQNLPDNWGDKPGFDYSNKGFSKVTFWARGELGGENLEFKVGGIDDASKKHRDSMAVAIRNVRLTREWSQYSIDLTGANLSSVIGGFCWVASDTSNEGKSITFYLDDIVME